MTAASKSLNLAVEDDRYRMTTLQDAINSTRKGDFQVVFDLKSAFHHVRLHVESYELMRFKVVDKKGITITSLSWFLVLRLQHKCLVEF
jgi:ActR/RegA family two-component response regulator